MAHRPGLILANHHKLLKVSSFESEMHVELWSSIDLVTLSVCKLGCAVTIHNRTQDVYQQGLVDTQQGWSMLQ